MFYLKNKINKKIAISIIITIFILAIISLIYLGFNKNNIYKNQLNQLYSSFNEDNTKENKFSIYQEIINYYDDNKTIIDKNLNNYYNDILINCKDYFKNYYLDEIDNSIEDIDQISDRNEFYQQLDKLIQIKEEIINDSILNIDEFDSLNEENINNYQNKLNELNNKFYQDKISAIQINNASKDQLNQNLKTLNNLINDINNDTLIKNQETKNNLINNINDLIKQCNNKLNELNKQNEEKTEVDNKIQQKQNKTNNAENNNHNNAESNNDNQEKHENNTSNNSTSNHQNPSNGGSWQEQAKALANSLGIKNYTTYYSNGSFTIFDKDTGKVYDQNGNHIATHGTGDF